jgi:hypothetical protein
MNRRMSDTQGRSGSPEGKISPGLGCTCTRSGCVLPHSTAGKPSVLRRPFGHGGCGTTRYNRNVTGRWCPPGIPNRRKSRRRQSTLYFPWVIFPWASTCLPDTFPCWYPQSRCPNMLTPWGTGDKTLPQRTRSQPCAIRWHKICTVRKHSCPLLSGTRFCCKTYKTLDRFHHHIFPLDTRNTRCRPSPGKNMFPSHTEYMISHHC